MRQLSYFCGVQKWKMVRRRSTRGHSEQFDFGIFESLHHAVVVADENLKITEFNRAAQQLFGHTRVSQVIGILSF